MIRRFLIVLLGAVTFALSACIASPQVAPEEAQTGGSQKVPADVSHPASQHERLPSTGREDGGAVLSAELSSTAPTTFDETNAPRIDINTATEHELETLPGIGPALAARIVEHRRRYGPFRRPEELIIVRGISERRFRQIRHLITVTQQQGPRF